MLNYDNKGVVVLGEIDDEYKSYFLGFIYADGCVYKVTKSNRQYFVFEISLAIKDETHLWKLNHIISFGRSKISKKCYSQKYLGVRLQFWNTRFCEELIGLGVIPNKSLVLRPPSHIPTSLIKHFVRGYFDGDGCITHYISGKKNRVMTKIFGTYQMLNFVDNWFKTQTDLPYKSKPHPKGNIWILSYTGLVAQKFLSLIYSDAFIFLDRKYILAEDYL